MARTLALAVAAGSVAVPCAGAAAAAAEPAVETSSPVATAAPDLRARLEAAVRAFRELEFEKARGELDVLAGGDGLAPADARDVALWRGIVLHALGDETRAEHAFQQALFADRTVALPPDISPKTAVLFNRVKAGFASPAGPQTERSSYTTIGILGAAAGLLAVGLGAYFGSASRTDRAAAQQEAFASDAEQRIVAARTEALAANVLFAAGGAVALGGGLFIVFDPGRPVTERAAR